MRTDFINKNEISEKNKIKWIVEKSDDLYKDINDAIVNSLINCGCDYLNIHYYDLFDNNVVKKVNDFINDDLKNTVTVVNGSINFIYKMADMNTCFYMPKFQNFKCSNYFNYFGKFLLNSNYVYSSLMEIRRNYQFYFSLFGNSKIFLRPNSPLKEFSGFVTDAFSLDVDIVTNFKKDIIENYLNSLFVVTSYKKILEEYRFVVSKKEILWCCKYREGGKLVKNKEIHPTDETISFVKGILNEVNYEPEIVYTIDIGRDFLTDKLGVIELNNFFSTGYYSNHGFDKLLGSIGGLHGWL
jgi:hypothetical protein